MIKYSCSCDNDLTEILLDDISGDIRTKIQNDVENFLVKSAQSKSPHELTAVL